MTFFMLPIGLISNLVNLIKPVGGFIIIGNYK